MSEQNEISYIKVPEEGFFFVPLGGVGEIGLNFYLYACDNEWLIVDCGIGFAGDVLPGVNILLPDPVFVEKISKNVKGIVITHAHEDHIGAVATFWRSFYCPVYVSPFANEMLETRLDEMGLLGRVPVEVFEQGDLLEIGPFEIETVPMNHSIPESMALLIKTKYGNIFHTGDWRFDDTPVLGKPSDYKALKALKQEKILAVVGDSTNAGVQEPALSENDVKESLIKLIASYQGKGLLVTCFASNVGRIESIAEAAQKCGREVCLLGRSLWRVEGAGRAVGYFKDVPEFLTDEEAASYKKSEILYLCTGCQGEPKAALSRISYGNGAFVPAKDDVVLFSSKVIPGNERSIQNIQNRFLAKGVTVVSADDALVHVSGHANAKDISKLYEMLKPEMVVPVHGEEAHLVAHREIAEKLGLPVVTVQDGDVLRLDINNPEILGVVETGVMARDGNRIIPVTSNVLKQRKRMIFDGTVVVTVFLNHDMGLIGNAQLSTIGLIDNEDPVMDTLKEAIQNVVNELSFEEKQNDKTLIEAIRSKVRKIITQTHGRRPMVEVHIGRA